MNKPYIPDFELERCCGSGAYGDVWIAKDMNGIKKAVKVLYKERLRNLGVLDKELRGLRLYCKEVPKHPNLVEVYHTGETEDIIYYVMEAADNASDNELEYIPDTLSYRLQKNKKLDPEVTIDLGWQILDAVSAIHQAGLVHRDIKPDNIIYVNGKPKLVDIGLITTATKNITLAGTRGFIPPEGTDGQSCDLYAVGKVLYCCMTGFDAIDFPSLPDDIKTDPLIRKLNNIILCACSAKPVCRYRSAFDFQTALVSDESVLIKLKNTKGLLSLVFVLLAIVISLLFFIALKNNKKSIVVIPQEIKNGSNIHLPEINMDLIYIPVGAVLVPLKKHGKVLWKKVFIPYNYWMSKYEINQRQYESIMHNNPSIIKKEDIPVHNVRYADALEFCRRLTKIEKEHNRLPIGYEYRLPTEREWLRAFECGKTNPENLLFNASNPPDYYAWYEKNSNKRPHSCGRKSPNELGIYDLSGNVWEYCCNPVNKNSEPEFYNQNNLIKGGSWKSSISELQITEQYFWRADFKGKDIGFRIVLAPRLR